MHIRRFAGRAAALLFACLPAASLANAQENVLQIRAHEVVLPDGSRLEDAVVVLENGKIRSVGEEHADPELPLVECDGVLTPGLIACQTASGAAGETTDSTRQLLPEARIVHAFEPDHPDFEKALAAGITTVVLAPSEWNLAGGLTAVVKTHGGEVLSSEGHLALSFSSRALAGGAQAVSFGFGAAEADPHLEATDGGLENTASGRRGNRPPTSYGGAVALLTERLGDTDGVFARAAKGKLPVYLAAWDRNEVLRAVQFATRHHLKGLLRGAPLAGDERLVGPIRESGLGVVLGPFALGQRPRSLESVKRLQDAGVPVGFALGAPARHPETFRWSGAMAVAEGADPAKVLDSMTATAARLAGVDERVGTIAVGKDADLVLWSGDPLDLSSSVEAVFVDGELVYRKEAR
ncbi:MAG TPA: hypothetical protein ENJ09_09790 [Planctomycetes bacterium]|nr:hypothetical protein [Planctomycetota bacterium]